MGSGPRYPAALMRSEVESIVSRLGSGRVLPCGSYRRECQTMGDIDLVIMDGSDVKADLLGLGLRIKDDDDPRTEFEMDVPWSKRPIKLDLWTPIPGRIGACVMHATGSGLHNVLMRRHGLARGLHFSWAGVIRLSDKAVLAAQTEDECFAALGWPNHPPQMRENVRDWVGPLMEALNAA